MEDLKNKVAVVTGAGGGIGYGIALACANEGMKLVLNDIHQERLEKNAAKLAEETNAEILTVVADVTAEVEVKRIAQETLSKFGRVDLVFNNAGVHFHKAFDLLTDKDWEWMLRSNVWSVIYGLRTFIPIMEKQKWPCTIVNVASAAGVYAGFATMCHYSAAKHANKAITEGVLYELKARNSNVNLMVVMPEFVVSNLMNSAAEVRQPQYRNEKEEQTDLDKKWEAIFTAAVTVGAPELNSISAEVAGQRIMQGVKEGKNYVFTHPNQTPDAIWPSMKPMIEEGKIPPAAI
jgi:NAD(P)-dependent dehydrogenase (short-subunit alcohol dehydrogenase family)